MESLVSTGFGTVREAVEVTRQGAEGFITKPFQFEELRHELSTAIERRRLRAENAYLRAQLRDRYCIDGMIMQAKALLDANPHPTGAQIKDALAANLCRCGTYNAIIEAVQQAATLMAKAR